MSEKAYRVVDERFAEVEKKVAKWNRRHAKNGIPEIKLEFRGEQEFAIDPDNKMRVIEWRTIYLVSELPAVADWNIVGIMHPASNDEGNLVDRIPGSDQTVDLTSFYKAEFRCDHCTWLRRRNDTFIIRHKDTGELKQVGSSCMSDFIEVLDPSGVMRMAEFLIEVEKELEKPVAKREYGKIDLDPKARTISLHGFLALVAKRIREDGEWKSAKNAYKNRGTSTARAAWFDLHDSDEILKLIDRDWAISQVALDWGREALDAGSTDTFEHNLATVLAGDAISYNESAIASCLFPTMARRLMGEGGIGALAKSTKKVNQAVANSQKKASNKSNAFLGKVGDKVSVDVIVKEVRDITRSYHRYERWLVKMEQVGTGATVTWFASREPEDFKVRDTMTITGKVKEHNTFRGENDTILTYCKVSNVVTADDDEKVAA